MGWIKTSYEHSRTYESEQNIRCTAVPGMDTCLAVIVLGISWNKVLAGCGGQMPSIIGVPNMNLRSTLCLPQGWDIKQTIKYTDTPKRKRHRSHFILDIYRCVTAAAIKQGWNIGCELGYIA